MDWTAAKEFNEQNQQFLHLYVEMESEAFVQRAVSTEILEEKIRHILNTSIRGCRGI